MTRAVADARGTLEHALARRAAAEQRVEQTWADAARRQFAARVLAPLDQETSRLHAALQLLDVELARALSALDG